MRGKHLSLLLFLLSHSRTQRARPFAARLARRFFTIVENIMDVHASNSANLLCATIFIILKVYVVWSRVWKNPECTCPSESRKR